MVQEMTDNFWQAEARSEETKKIIKDIKLYVASDIETNRPPRIPDTLRVIALFPGISIIVPSFF